MSYLKPRNYTVMLPLCHSTCSWRRRCPLTFDRRHWFFRRLWGRSENPKHQTYDISILRKACISNLKGDTDVAKTHFILCKTTNLKTRRDICDAIIVITFLSLRIVWNGKYNLFYVCQSSPCQYFTQWTFGVALWHWQERKYIYRERDI